MYLAFSLTFHIMKVFALSRQGIEDIYCTSMLSKFCTEIKRGNRLHRYVRSPRKGVIANNGFFILHTH